jgi:hypothetical protein
MRKDANREGPHLRQNLLFVIGIKALLGYNGNPSLLEVIAYGVISSPSARPVGNRAERWFQLLKPALELLNVFPKMRLLS